jgi:hypothetical protein
MKRTRVAAVSFVALVATGVVSLSVLAAKPQAKASGGDAPTIQSAASLLEGFRWGVNHAEVLRIYNATDGRFDQEYNPVLAKMQPGSRMQALEADRDNRKAAFAASFIEFKDTPTGYDSTGIKDEFTYRNHESVMNVDKDGKRRYFFFIGAPPGERFWKFYDEIALKEGGPLGKTFQEAVTKLNVQLGAAARVRAADPSQGITVTTADWQDASTHVRAMDRSYQHIVGVVLEERQTLGALPNLRSNKADDPLAMDPSISAITKGGISDPSASANRGSDAGAAPKKK